jgi:hypothetical protein
MTPFRIATLCRTVPLTLAIAAASTSALACSADGCTLSSNWEALGFSTQQGFKMDIRYDYVNQDQLRSGTHSIAPAEAAQKVTSNGEPQEVEKYTRSNYINLGLDYTFNVNWGVNLQLPYVNRHHATLGTGSNGSDPADGAYESQTSSLGDVKLVGRYQGLAPNHNLGLLLGVKLPTGSHTRTGTSTDPADPGASAPIDRGLQPGSGTTDAIVGAYYFDSLSKHWDYFGTVTAQMAMNSRDDYKPGNSYNLNLGLRYMGMTDVMTPQIQLNTQYLNHDSGAEADTTSTGKTAVYLTPGVVVPLTRQASIYGFVQVPIYQDVRGVQLTARYTTSIAALFAF